MLVKRKADGKEFNTEKNDDMLYPIEDKFFSAEEMKTQFEIIKKPVVKKQEVTDTIGMTPQEPVISGENIPALFEALSKAQGVMATGKKNVDGYGYQYMDMSQVIDISKKPLSTNGLAVVQFPSTYMHGKTLVTRVTTIITHKAGGSISSNFDSPTKETSKQALIQTIGTLVSYMSRYSRNNILGISADKDTDGV